MSTLTIPERSSHRSLVLIPGYMVFVILGIIELATPYDVFDRRVALCITDLAAIIGLAVLQRSLARHGHHLPVIVQWSVLVGVAFDAAGNFLRLYGSVLWWDKLAHAIGSAAVALALYALVWEFRNAVPFAKQQWWMVLYVIGTTSLLATLYEISEYLGDLKFHTHRVTDFFDTSDDLMWNVIGSVAVLILLHLFHREKRPQEAPTESRNRPG